MRLSKIRALAMTAACTGVFVSLMPGFAFGADGEISIASGLITIYPSGLTNLLGLGSTGLFGDVSSATSLLNLLLGNAGLNILGRPLGL